MIRQMAVPDHAGIEAAGRVHRSTPWSGHSRKVRRIDRPEVSGRNPRSLPNKAFFYRSCFGRASQNPTLLLNTFQ
jgi:hypothetical protein